MSVDVDALHGSSRRMASTASVADRLRELSRGERLANSVDAEWREGVGDGIRDRRGCAHHPALGHALHPERRARVRPLDMLDLECRESRGRRDGIVEERRAEVLAVRGVDDLLGQRAGEAWAVAPWSCPSTTRGFSMVPQSSTIA